MSTTHVWTYREEVTDIPKNSILHILDAAKDTIYGGDTLRRIFQRRANLEYFSTNTPLGITSELNDEIYAAAVQHIIAHIEANKPILIWGDYDVDGMTSTSAMVHCLKACGADVKYAVPNRLDQGYGVDSDLIRSLVLTGALVITVDNGISDIEPIERLISYGYDVIITDHHIAESDLPKATHIVNPKVQCSPENEEYMAPGVYVAAKIALKVARHFVKPYVFEDLKQFCSSMVAMGIVSDVIELNPIMRHQLMFGIASLNNTRHAGLKALFGMCGAKDNQALSSTFLSYSVVPKLNAAGRMGQPLLGVELLLMQYDDSVNYTTSLLAANNLKYLNADRKIIESTIYDEAVTIALEQLKTQSHGLVIFKKDWHPGVLGIIAARIAETFYRPTIVITNEGDMVKGSGRSVPNFDLHAALQQCEDTLIAFGGHKAAAGVKLTLNNVKAFQEKFNQIVQNTEISKEQVFEIDADVSFQELYDVQFQIALQCIEPTGNKNSELIFKLPVSTVVSSEVKRDALHLILRDEHNLTLMVSKFRSPDEYSNLLHKQIEVLVSPSVTYFSGSTSVEWRIQSIRVVN